MLTYTPPGLEADLESAYETFSYTFGLDEIITDFYNVTDPDFDKNGADDVITPETELTLTLPGYDDQIPSTVKEFVDLANELKTAKLVDNLKCRTNQRTLCRVATSDYDTFKTLKQNLESTTEMLHCSIDTSEGRMEFSLVGGPTIFGFLIASREEYEDYFPTVLDDDIFVQVKYPFTPDERIVDDLVEAYLFELSSSGGIDLSPSARPYLNDLEIPGEDDERLALKVKLRPLMFGKGMGALLSLYNSALKTHDPEIRILYFTKIFEYVSQSVVRLQLTSVIQSKLNSPRALAPDADYVLELESLYDEQKVFKKDKEAIIITALACCEPLDLAQIAPKHLEPLSKITSKSKKKERDDALREFASVLVDTRNLIAHAKSNYQPTGAECPPDQMHQLASCAKLAAQQAIRWFNGLSEQQRVA